MAMLTKTASVMSHEPGYDLDGLRAFYLIDEETKVINRVVHLNDETFADMGSPETITVTIEPGDRLDALNFDYSGIDPMDADTNGLGENA